ncbi:MAG: DUF1016 family protein [Thermoplasmata archaeon]|nr:DUF1016 family protein [Thermoplasmata archaeon]
MVKKTGKEKALAKQNKKIDRLEGYNEILTDIQSLLEKAKYQAYKAVDNLRVQTYWQIGERIVRGELEHKERADYGERLIENLASDLGFSRRLMYEIVKSYETYPIVQTVSAQLSWSHYTTLIRVVAKQERKFYEIQSIQNRWSVRKLRDTIKSNLFERAKRDGKLIAITPLPLKEIEPDEIFKDTYDFKFLELRENHTENELKTALLAQLESFLHELGKDFFIGRREAPILIGGNYDRIDLELFHAGLLCYILVEVKTEKFKHSHVSQIYSYLNWYKEHKWHEGMRQPIGLIICKTKDDETVHYALGDLKKEIFVAEYLTRLPDEQEIKKGLREIELKPRGVSYGKKFR